ncbi:MAG: hypothetical protein ACRDND_08640 [Streptosporangiaceae bacterium]
MGDEDEGAPLMQSRGITPYDLAPPSPLPPGAALVAAPESAAAAL